MRVFVRFNTGQHVLVFPTGVELVDDTAALLIY